MSPDNTTPYTMKRSLKNLDWAEAVQSDLALPREFLSWSSGKRASGIVRKGLALLGSTCLCTLALVFIVHAGPDQCTQSNGTAFCGGNQSDGVVVGTDTVNSINTLTINNLNGDIDAPILWLDNATAQSRSLQVLSQNRSIHGGTAGPAAAVEVTGSTGTATTIFVAKVLALSTTASDGPAVNLYRGGANGKSLSPSSSKANAPAASSAGQTFATFDAKGSPGQVSVTSAGTGIAVVHLGGMGGAGTRAHGKSGTGGSGGQISIVTETETVVDSGGVGVLLHSTGGNSTDGPSGKGTRGGGDGGTGGDGGGIFVNGDANGAEATEGFWSVTTTGENASGIEMRSIAGNGSNGGSHGGGGSSGDGGNGGNGGNGGTITVYDGAPIAVSTSGDSAHGIVAVSSAGYGGKGRNGTGTSVPGNGGIGGQGSSVTIGGTFAVSTLGEEADGIVASSAGGAGNTGGTGKYGGTGTSGSGGRAGVVAVNVGSGSSIVTKGGQAVGVSVQSIAGRGGAGASSTGVLSFGANGGSAGYAGTVGIDNAGSVKTSGIGSQALLAQSVGGGGGSGGTSFGVFYSSGGSGSYGGNGGTVTVNNSGALTTKNHAASAIEAQSIGGSGGSGGSSGAIAAIGGGAAKGGSGGTVTVTNSGDIATGSFPSSTADQDAACSVGCSYGVLAQSIGDGGGNGGSTGGWFSLGAKGGSGGSGGSVTVTQHGASIDTELESSTAILAQSLGGGGGNGGSLIAAGLFASAAIGGSGGVGGSGGTVDVALGDNSDITTAGKLSHGVQAQSVGGGGGNGGYSVAVAVSVATPAISVSVGGTGGAAGSGKAVTVTSTGANSSIGTTGDDSHGVFAQSIGGGGGNGGFAVSAAATGASVVGAISVGVGGEGGSGNTGGNATVMSVGDISTKGHRSTGLLAQSLGGSGGNGGFAVSGSLSIEGSGAAIGVGGTGGSGGNSNAIAVTSSSTIDTLGSQSPGISAQSIGGGGGTGGLSVAGTVTFGAASSASVALAVGGSGGAGGNSATLSSGPTVSVTSNGDITTAGEMSQAILAQSVGGGGGNGGLAIAGSLTATSSQSLALDIALGGKGNSGGAGALVSVESTGKTVTSGGLSSAIVAQSIGGGGGTGGGAIEAAINLGKASSLGLALGAKGGIGGDAKAVSVTATGDVETMGAQSDGMVAQSIGAGGGNGGFSVSGNLSTSDSYAVDVAIGGAAGSGGTAGDVTVDAGSTKILQDISVTGDGSRGIVAQSIGGGGGTGGTSITGSFTTSSDTKQLSVSVGGVGGSGATSGTVTVNQSGAISTGATQTGATPGLDGEHGILAQSIAGGGGSGGLAITSGTNRGSKNLNVSVGGGGGAGALASAVNVNTSGSITTHAANSHAVMAQSIGGGGGTGGATTTFEISSDEAKSINVTVGGGGGTGNAGGSVSVKNSSVIAASGTGSQGIQAQSIGGGGGNGGSNNYISNKFVSTTSSLAVGVGGGAGAGGGSGGVTVSNSGSITTGQSRNAVDEVASSFDPGYGVFAQSVSSGGGSGGIGINGPVATTGKASLVVGVGGAGSGTEAAGDVSVTNGSGGRITTSDHGAHGIYAQSVGGGGGNGAAGIGGDITNSSSKGLIVGVGGAAGGGGDGGDVTVMQVAKTIVCGDGAKGILAQSIGGGGGNGGIGIDGSVEGTSSTDSDNNSESTDSSTAQIVVGIAGKAGSGGQGGDVTVSVLAAITTGTDADTLASTQGKMDGIFAQSIGGGGGNASAGIAGDITNPSSGKAAVIGFSRSGGGTRTGGTVSVTSTAATISVAGDGSRGIVAQSIGGTGGEGSIGIDGDIKSADSASDTTQLQVGVGGGGGSGGTASAVTVNNSSAITTNASDGTVFTNNHGILAQSIGGGGGNAGAGISGDVENGTKSKALIVGVGGFSSGGGSGGIVTVTNEETGNIAVSGGQSVGIFAQSIAGGGGNGGVGISGNISSKTDAESNTQIALSIGASGGGNANRPSKRVFVGNSASIATAQAAQDDAMMHGIVAQSIGGGGGSGAVGIDGNITGAKDSKALTLAVGGSGGVAGNGALNTSVTLAGAGVAVENSGTILVSGDGSKGIIAQNIGGGGGNGASGLNGTVDTGDGKAVTMSVGLSGGNGGSAGTVTVVNTGDIATDSSSGNEVSEAHGIFAQSIGGGGGSGTITGSLVFGDVNTKGTVKGIAVNLGATGSKGGTPGTVTVLHGVNEAGGDTQNAIATYQPNSHGILAQSVGNGGGTAGDLGGIGTDDGSLTWSAAVDIGATAGTTGNDGGAVTIGTGSQSTIITSGYGSYGLLAQSIGGGGGTAADATNATSLGNAVLAVNLGGSGGELGNGDAVDVTSLGQVSTTGSDAIAIFAQSIGAGGGKAASGALALSGTVTLGGTGGASGDGGDVTVTADGLVSTKSKRASGIVAQSVGGGGGYVGSPRLQASSNFGSGLNFGAGTDTDGLGGEVSVTSSAQISTKGTNAIGIFAQSVGGGGGVRGSVTQSGSALVGSAGGTGAAGAVQISLASGASVYTTASQAHGVFAQSAGGGGSATSSGTKTSVDVASGVQIAATGSGAHGVYAQSVGQGMGKIDVTIGSNATVTGGKASNSTAEDGAGIFVKDGTSATISNMGRITSVLGIDGVAIYNSGADLTISNTGGTITGSIIQKSSTVIENSETGVINSGVRLEVTRLINNGLVEIGGRDNIAHTQVTGTLEQNASGGLRFELDHATEEIDMLGLSSSAVIDGVLDVDFVNLGSFDDAMGSIEFLVLDSSLSQTPTLLGSVAGGYSLSTNDSGNLAIDYNIDFDSEKGLAGGNGNQAGVLKELDALYRIGILGTNGDAVAVPLLNIETSSEYQSAASSLSGEIFADTQLSTLLTADQFGRKLLGCGAGADGSHFDDGTRCGWLSFGSTYFDQSSNSVSSGFTDRSYEITGGTRFEISPGLEVGFGLGYYNKSISTDARASADGQQFQSGIVVLRHFGDATIAAIVGGGMGWFDTERSVFTGENAAGDQKVWNISGRLRGAYEFGSEMGFVTPSLEIGIDRIGTDGLRESGSSGSNLVIESSADTFVSIRPAVEFGRAIETRNGKVLRTRALVGLTHYFNGDGPTATSMFGFAEGFGDGAAAEAPLDRNFLDISVGVELATKRNFSLHAGTTASFSENTRNYGGQVGVEWKF